MRLNFTFIFVFIILVSVSNVIYSESLNQGFFIIHGYKFEIHNSEQDPNFETLLKQLEDYESYRPDSCSDLTRNPFGSGRYKAKDLLIQFDKTQAP